MTDVVPIPEGILSTEFPTNADRTAGTFNPRVVAWGDSARAMSERDREIAVAGRTNALAAQEAAAAAVPAAAQAVAARNEAVPAAVQAVAAANAAVPAAAQAVDAAQRAEDAAASIEDGPVTSVNSKTGVVVLESEDIADPATEAEMRLGTETGYRSMSPALVHAAVGGINQIGTIYTGSRKPAAGTWLECGKVYLQSSYAELYAELGLLHDYSEVVSANTGITFTAADTIVSGMTFGGGKFVAVASAGSTAVSTSDDGRVWQARTMPVAAAWSAVAYGGGRFVAVSNGTASAASTDGINWTQGALPVSANWVAITYGAGLFVALANSGAVAATSPDGITWTARTLPASATWSAVAFGNGSFVAVARTSATSATSPDGITWTARTQPAGMQGEWNSMAFGAGVFVVVKDYASTTVSIQSAWSVDGITWTTTPIPNGSSNNLRAVVWAVDKFVIFGASGSTALIATSATGKAWTSASISTYFAQNEVPVASAAGNGFVAMFASTATASRACVSLNGTTWESGRSLNGTIPGFVEIMFFADRFFISTQQNMFFTSTDGINWTPRGIPGVSINSVAYGNGQYVALGNNGSNTSVSISADGLNWTAGLVIPGNDVYTSIAYGAGKFVAVHSSGKIAYTSDLVTWTVVSLGSSLSLNGIAFGAGRFIVSANNANYWTSTDGIAWTSARSPIGGLTSIGFMGGRFVAMAGSTTLAAVATSSDGIAWETAVMPLAVGWGAVSYGEGLFFTTSSTGGAVVAVSADCKTWAMKKPDGFSGAAKSAYGAGHFVGMPSSTAGNYMTLPYASYSRATQFYVPRAAPEVQGIKQWMRAA